MSAMVKAMRQQDKVAIVRFVRRDNAEPKIGILYPVERVEGETRAEYFHFAEAPFSEVRMSGVAAPGVVNTDPATHLART